MVIAWNNLYVLLDNTCAHLDNILGSGRRLAPKFLSLMNKDPGRKPSSFTTLAYVSKKKVSTGFLAAIIVQT